MPRRTSVDDFWARVDKSGECWLWTGSKNDHHGYGAFGLGGKWWLTHRLSYTLANGPIPPRLAVLHRCDNPPCVRPDHLFLGTRADNIADMNTKGRGGQGKNPRRGDAHGRHKITEASAVAVREAFLGGEAIDSIAARFETSRSNVSCIGRGKSWKHLADTPAPFEKGKYARPRSS